MGKFVSKDNLSYVWGKVKTLLGGKVDKVSGKGLSTNDYTTDEKNKLSGIAAGAEVNVQSDWNVTDSSSDAFIKNKPTIPTNTNQLTNGAGFVTSSGSVASATNATKLNNQEPSYYLNYNNLSNKPTIPDVSGFAKTSDLNTKLTGSKYNANNPNVFCGYNAENNANSEYIMAFKNNSNTYGFCHSQFANMTNSSKLPSACTYNGFFYVSSTTNSLSGADANPFLQYHTSSSDFRILTTAYSDIWLQQIATDFRTEHVYIRRKENGTWSAWTKLAKSTDIPTLVTLTQAEYDALATKDSNTYYFIKE